MRQPTAPETQASSRRTSKNYDNADTWSQGMGREARESRDSQSWDYGRDPRDTRSLSQSREYTRTSPSEWKPYSQRRVLYPPSLQMDSDCRSEMQPLRQQQQQEEEDDDEEAYWSSVRTLYEKLPSCSRPRPVSASGPTLLRKPRGPPLSLARLLSILVTKAEPILAPFLSV